MISNETVLITLHSDQELLSIVKRHKLDKLDHVVRGEKFQILSVIIQGKSKACTGLVTKTLPDCATCGNGLGYT